MKLLRCMILMVVVTMCHGKTGTSGSSSSSKAAKAKAAAKIKAENEEMCMNKARTCVSVTGSMETNLARPYPCEGATHPCMVVVNDEANTTALCRQWSPNSFWDGSFCMCRCESLGGVLRISMGESWCHLDGRSVVKFDSYIAMGNAFVDSVSIFGFPMHDSFFMAPIQCGTWLGARDSAANGSFFTSQCFSILENRNEVTQDAKISPCGINKHTTGCRFIGPFVPECRKSNQNECGVQVQCPTTSNPCGLGADINSNLDNKYSTCKSITNLALNFIATPSNCNQWSENAFVLDGRCVSSCGVVDYECKLNGVAIPPCSTTRDSNNAITEVTPAVCAVPMRADAFSGVRNGFHGMSRVLESKCLYSTDCTNASACTKMEGLNVWATSPFEQTNALPVCIGDPSKTCKIEYPCPVLPAQRVCKDGVLKVSEAIYTSFGLYNCTWFGFRDGVIIVCWFVALCVYCSMDEGFKEEYCYDNQTCGDSALCFIYFVILGGLACVWEFALPFVCIACCVYNKKPTARVAPSPNYSDMQASGMLNGVRPGQSDLPGSNTEIPGWNRATHGV